VRERNRTTLLVVSAFSARDDDDDFDDDDFVDETVLSVNFTRGQKDDDERFYRREYAASAKT
jgi:hypothetical protein